MKRSIIGLVAVVAVVGAIFLFSNQKPSVSTVPTQIADQKSGSFVVTALAADVFVKNPEDKDYILLNGNREIITGSFVKTGPTGRAALLYPNGAVTRIDVNSEVKVDFLEANGNRSKLRLLTGGILAKLRNALGGEDYYEIQTQNSVASIRGTIFSTQFLKNKSKILTLENKVSVAAFDPKSEKPIATEGININQGEKLILDNANLPSGKNPLKNLSIVATDLIESVIKNSLDEEDIINPIILEIYKGLNLPLPSPQSVLRYEDVVERKNTITPVPTAEIKPSVIIKPSPKVSATPTPNLTRSPQVSPSASPIQPATVTATPIPTAINSIKPNTVNAGDNSEIIVNGTKLFSVRTVLIGTQKASFFAADETSIFARVPTSLTAGVYDVRVILTSGGELTLSQVLTVK